MVAQIAPKLLTVAETAELLRKSDAQLRWMIHTGTAPRSAKIGGRRMFREADVLAWIDAAFEGVSGAPVENAGR